MNNLPNCRIRENFPIRHVYIHVPFCQSKCGYCSFYSQSFSKSNKAIYLQSLALEITQFLDKYQIIPHTIYFGGGTPSLLEVTEIEEIIAKFNLSEIAEITLEVNPITITEEYVAKLAKTKINRISMGVQSFVDDELELLGRLHDSKQAENAFWLLRKAGFRNISLDLIYGLPDQDEISLKRSLKKLAELNPEHISTYCLSLEPDVPLHKYESQIPSDEKVADFYDLIRKKLLTEGYEHYEISNFSKPTYFSKHNSCYWQDAYYLGLGPAASGYLDKRRYSNNELEQYVQDMAEHKIMANAEVVSEEEHKKEYIFLALRQSKGVVLKDYKQKFGTDFWEEYKAVLKKYEQYFCRNSTAVYLKPKFYFVSNAILAEFM